MKTLVRYTIICFLFLLFKFEANSQCPPNINFSTGDISFWSAQTGLVNGPTQVYPAPNVGLSSFTEYTISNIGMSVQTSQGTDLYGGFPIIPTINGYAYNYSVKLGSTATSFDLHGNSPNPGGFTRSITYQINVPAGPVSEPYTMTYAYAMVLENGTHNSNQQPLFKATLNTVDSIFHCASAEYFLPTFNNAGGGGTGSTGATLDTASAIALGFSLSPVPFLSHSGQNNTGGTLLYDVWTKGWTEVTFDLAPYRGRQVTLTFESDNCTPGGHFAYAYVALRNTCEGLQISGNPVACTGAQAAYSIPALANAVYDWQVPAGWTIVSGTNSNILTVIPGNTGGNIIAHEVNGCADLRDTLAVTTSLPTVAGSVISDATVCAGNNSTFLNLTGQRGNILNWLSSPDGVNWNTITNTTGNYTAQNLNQTTYYSVVVQNGAACKADTAAAALITVNPKSVGGILAPPVTDICFGQNVNVLLQLSGNTGSVVNWQMSTDSISWSNFAPANTTTSHNITSLNRNEYYRTIVKSGVCPADTSKPASLHFYNVPIPIGAITPDSSIICYGKSTTLSGSIGRGTSYTWSPTSSLSNTGSGVISSLPFVINVTAAPRATTDYVLTVLNNGCPVPFKDTFHVEVTPPIIVNAGSDTTVVINQPLQFNATANDPRATIFTWTPTTGLNNPNIYNPIGLYNLSMPDKITYTVSAKTSAGCEGTDNITVTIFRTGPELFVPSAFTPDGDGLNDYIYPICVGIQELKYFRIYNRWGQLVFSTNVIGDGWDGRIKGIAQSTNNFVYIVEAVDYLGQKHFKKGNITLIR